MVVRSICASTGVMVFAQSATRFFAKVAKVLPLLKINGASVWQFWHTSSAAGSDMAFVYWLSQRWRAFLKFFGHVFESNFCPWQNVWFSVKRASHDPG